MGEINNAIALQAAPPPYDPLATVGKISGVQAQLLQNKLLQQQYGSAISTGRAISGALDPETGLPDPGKVGQYFSAHPDEAQYAAPAIEKAQAFRTGQLGNQKTSLDIGKADLELSQNRWKVASGVFDGLLASKAPLNADTVLGVVRNDMIPLGHFNDKESMGQVLSFAQGLPESTGNPAADDAATRAYLQRWSLQANNALEHVNTLLGDVTKTDTGPAIVANRLGGLQNGVMPIATFDKGLTPGEKTGLTAPLVEQSGPMAGVPQARSVGQVFDAYGNARAPGGAPDGSAPPAGAPGAAPGASGTGAGPAATLGPTALAPGKAEAMSVTEQEGAKQAADLTRSARLVPDRRAALANLTQTLKDFQPGPKADLTYQLGALATQFGLAAPKSAKGVAAQEEFNKLASQIALAQFSALGGTGANEQLATTLKANPNQAMSKMGIKNVTALLQGNNDAIDAMSRAWQKYSEANGPGSFQKFTNEWNQHYDPRVFQYLHMDRKAQLEMIGSMTKKELARFKTGADLASALGY